MKRNAQTPLYKYLDQPGTGPFNVLLIQGARQVGKSTLVQQSLVNRPHVALNLETQKSLRNEIDQTANFKEFTQLLKIRSSFTPGSTLFIDEAQESLKLGHYVREMKETWKSSKVLLTGSSMSKLFNDDIRVPVGRIEFLTIHPFSFREFLRWKNLEALMDQAIDSTVSILSIPDFLHKSLLEHFNTYLKTGGLPEVVKADSNYKDVLNEIFLSQQDDFLRKEKLTPTLFSEALKGISNHIGYPSKLTHLAQNSYQAHIILTQLKAWNLAYEVDVVGAVTSQSTSKKRYLYDLGIMQYLRNAPTPEIQILETLNDVLRQPLGGVLENAVLLNYLSQIKAPGPLSTWKKNAKTPIEVDFVFDIKSKKTPVEVKAALKVSNRHCKNIFEYLHLYGLKKGLLISLDQPKVFEIEKTKIFNLPAYLPLTTIALLPD